ncbi:MAG: sulfatase-like hydrolase/transferase [Polyangia bacterium]|jgi:arylsulfatase A-like enzyme|nr:sulfatase-like hydrolase/transferase [Polyangia bacterium]
MSTEHSREDEAIAAPKEEGASVESPEDSSASAAGQPPPGFGLKGLLMQDLRRGASAALLAIGLAALVEYIVTIWAAPHPVRFATALRFVALDVTLWAFFGLLFLPLVAASLAGSRLALWLIAPDKALSWRGLLVPGAVGLRGPSKAAGWIFGLLLTLPLYVAASAHLTLRLWPYFHAKQLLGLMLALIQLGLFLVLGLAAVLVALGLGRLGRALHGRLGAWNPFGQLRAAMLLLGLLLLPALFLVHRAAPDLAEVVPWRLLVAAVALLVGLVAGGRLLAWRGGLLPKGRVARRVTWAASLGLGLLLSSVTLVHWGADPETKLLAVTSSPPLHRMIDGVRWANDFDRDGYGSLLGENDCAPFDRRIHPGARDIPDNGIDENCDGRDFSLKRQATYKDGQRMEVPEAYRRDWNILFLTVDDVRYDHTGFGGYIEKRGRDTTPFLDELVKKSTSFTFANAPAAGTVASVPAIITSKFFHSGIALSGERPGKPPKLLPENWLVSEVMKRGGYTTGAILTHEYFNDWGMEQGFDTYDNEIGAKRAPYAVTSPALTRKVISWIARNSSRKWFLWAHYLDPHGRYVAHPGEKSFGTTEEDLYDGEIWFTDKWLRTLFEELWRMPGGNRTIVVITSDHGDGFREHGHINHGWGLHRELIHVPLIFYVPDLPPRLVDGATSPLDVLPTLADLAGIDVSDLSFEGESLVPQLFYGKDAHHRVVFSETNYPHPQRAAVTSRYKLIHNLKANLYQLFDLKSDPWEHKNIYQQDPKVAKQMRGYLSDWMERVFYADDIRTNQAAALRKWHRMPGPPRPRSRAKLTFADGALEVLGFDLQPAEPRAGDEVEVTIYFGVRRQPSDHLSFRLSAWPGVGDGGRRGAVAYSPTMPTAHGLFPTTRWKAGDFMRDRFKVRLRREWSASQVSFGLEVFGRTRPRYTFDGQTRGGQGNVGELGQAPLRPPSAAPTMGPQGRPGAQRKRRGCGCGADAGLPALPLAPFLIGVLVVLGRRHRRRDHEPG